MSNKLNLLLATHRRNLRLTQYDLEAVLQPFEHAVNLVDAFSSQRAAIESDRKLSQEGKASARQTAATRTREALRQWHEARLMRLNADLSAQRAALLGNAERPDPTRVAMMAAELTKFAPDERAILYNSASDANKRLMEAASTATGDLPTKTASGLEWKTLLDPEMLDAAILERAAKANPVAAARLQELTEIRAMQIAVTGVAMSEI